MRRFISIRRLSTKLAIFYAGLFALALLLVMATVRVGIERYAEAIVTRQMETSANVFAKLWRDRYAQMQSAAGLLAADFGFRAAVATRDDATIVSALENLKQRNGLALALVVTLEGEAIGTGAALSETEAAALWDALDRGNMRGVLSLGGIDYGAAAAVVRAPVDVGWLVLGSRIDASAMRELAALSSIRLEPSLIGVRDLPQGFAIGEARRLSGADAGTLAHATAITDFDGRPNHVLVTRYSLSGALAEYRPMLVLATALAVAGLILVVAGSWLLARRITRPIAALAAAAERVGSGRRVEVRVESSDEIGALAGSFNRMVTAIAEREERITHIAFHDALTGLPNRKLFREKLDMLLRREAHTLAVVAIDLDNFKSVNDTLGHPIGDKLLCEVVKRFECCTGDALLARLGGDEFAIILDGPDAANEAGRMAAALIASVEEHFIIEDQRMAIGASIGIAVAPGDGSNADALIKNADLALYRAKNDGRGTFCYFESAMDAQAQERRRLELDLRLALDGGQFELFFQPLFSLRDNAISSFEALLRWNHPTRGLVSPAEFIPLAEASGLIVPMGAWIIDEACRQASRWPSGVHVAVNVSPVQFRSPELAGTIVAALERHRLPADALEIEITESLFIEDVEGTLAALHRLRDLGVRVALDDFGTGYSSLSYLRSFPFDKLKIDRSFITDLATREGSTAIIRAITTLADALGMETTAEGVEDSDQLDILRREGCSHIQGYLFSRPVPASHVGDMLRIANGVAAAATDVRLTA